MSQVAYDLDHTRSLINLTQQYYSIESSALSIESIGRLLSLTCERTIEIQNGCKPKKIDEISFENMTDGAFENPYSQEGFSIAAIGRNVKRFIDMVVRAIKSLIEKVVNFFKALAQTARNVYLSPAVMVVIDAIIASNSDSSYSSKDKSDDVPINPDNYDIRDEIANPDKKRTGGKGYDGGFAIFDVLSSASLLSAQASVNLAPVLPFDQARLRKEDVGQNVYEGRERPILLFPSRTLEALVSTPDHRVSANATLVAFGMGNLINHIGGVQDAIFDSADTYLKIVGDHLSEFERLVDSIDTSDDHKAVLESITALDNKVNEQIIRGCVPGRSIQQALGVVLPGMRQLRYIESVSNSNAMGYDAVLRINDRHAYDGNGYVRLAKPSKLKELSLALSELPKIVTKVSKDFESYNTRRDLVMRRLETIGDKIGKLKSEDQTKYQSCHLWAKWVNIGPLSGNFIARQAEVVRYLHVTIRELNAYVTNNSLGYTNARKR